MDNVERPPDSTSRRPYVMTTITVPETLPLVSPVLDEMRSRGWRTGLVLGKASYAGFDAPDDIAVTQINMTRAPTPLQDAVSLARMTWLFWQEKPDAVIGSTPKAAMLGMIGARLARVPVRVFLVRGAAWDAAQGRRATVLRWADRVTAACSTQVVAVSRSLADLLVEQRITTSAPVVVGRGGSKGVDTRAFHPPADTADSRLRLGFLGRLAQDKGIEDVLDVYNTCSGQMPQVTLDLAGALDPANPISEGLQERLDSPGITYHGLITDVPAFLRGIDLLVFPSTREGLPNAVIEAAATGVPSVAYAVTGVVDAVDDGTTGRLVPPGDVAALGQAAVELLRSPDLPAMKRAARDFAVRWFAQEKVVTGFVDYIEGQMEQAAKRLRSSRRRLTTK